MDLTPDWYPVIMAWLSQADGMLNAEDISFANASALLQSLLLVSYDDRIPFLKSIVRFS